LLQLSLLEIEHDRIGHQVPVPVHRVRRSLGDQPLELPSLEAHIDPPAAQAEAVGAETAQRRLSANEGTVASLSSVESQRVTPGGEVAPVDGHLATGPETVAPLEAHPVGHDDVGFDLLGRRRRVLGEVADLGPAHRVHLQGVTNALDLAEVVQ
jgi:hypothetical protein